MNHLIFALIMAALLIANYWTVRSLYDVFFLQKYVIAPFQISGDKSADEKLGGTLALMLQSRLVQIQRDLETSQRFLQKKPSEVLESNSISIRDTRASFVSPLPLPLVQMRTNLFQPLNINVAVSGVSLGGLFAWVHQKLASPRTLQFSVYTKGDRANISCDLRTLSGPKGDSLSLETGSEPIEITEMIAYALIRKKISEAETEDIDALDVNEVRTLLATLFKVAAFNRKIELGRAPSDEIQKLLPEIEPLAQKAPRWPALVFFAASMAGSAGQNLLALHYYEELKRLASHPPNNAPIPVEMAFIDSEIARLTPAAETVRDIGEQNFITAAKEYAKRLELPGPDPDIVFRPSKIEGIYTLWDHKAKRFEVNTEFIDSPGLPEYTALMGRFMLKHYDRCMGKDGSSMSEIQMWNDFRNTLTSYIISQEPTLRKPGGAIGDFGGGTPGWPRYSRTSRKPRVIPSWYRNSG